MYKLSALEICQSFREGELKAEEIVDAFLRRIALYNGKLGAFLSVFEEKALEKARNLDKKRRSGQPLGSLAGVPVALKDNIHVKGELTTCASKFLRDYCAVFNATVVNLLEKEDAIIIGKTNLDEFAMGSSTESSSLLQTYNPWDLSCVPGGSSGGSAAAVAARLCPIALGSDTGGSIRQPASFCGVLGFKPTYGRVSRYGLVAFGSSLDQIGPMATRVSDIGLVMEAIAKHCKRDSTSLSIPREDYLPDLNGKISGLRIGVPWKFLDGLSEESRKNFDSSIDVFKRLSFEIVDVDLDILRYSLAVYYILANAEASTNLSRFDGIRYGKRSSQAKTLDELYELSKEEGFGEEVKRRILLGTYVLSSGYQDAYYKKAQKVRTLIIQEYERAFQACDAIAMPVTPSTSFVHGSIKDPLEMYLADVYTISANLAGIPAISLPSGFDSAHRPFGLQIQAPQLQDVFLCKVANSFEKATRFGEEIPKLFEEGEGG